MRATGSGAALRQAAGDPVQHRSEAASAWITLLVRALGLDRAVLLVAHGVGRPYEPLAFHGPVRPAAVARGAVPGDGPWSAILPLDPADGPSGLLLLARPGGTPLPAADRTLLRHLVDGAVALLERRRPAGDGTGSPARLDHADRLGALGTLAAGIAHEVRNPLVSVRSFVQLLPERLDDEEFRTGFRDLALAEIDRITALLGEVLAFARPAAAEREPLDLSALAAAMLRLLAGEARTCGVALASTLADTLPCVVGDEAQLKQVLMNVVLNAIQATPPRGTVAVETFADGDVVLEVCDDGPGIPAERLSRIFEPFFTTKDEGSGLGLFVAHRIVREHGGTIAARTRSAGGTVFSIRLPIAGEARRG